MFRYSKNKIANKKRERKRKHLSEKKINKANYEKTAALIGENYFVKLNLSCTP